MSSKALLILIIALVTIVAPLSCDGDLGSGPGEGYQFSPEDKTEAELAALWLSGELVAPDTLYERFLDRMLRLRLTYRETIPEVDIRFVFPGEPSRITVMFTDQTAAEFRSGVYTKWDSLNSLLGLMQVDTSILFDRFHWAYLKFEGLLHPRILASYYETLDGIVYASAGGRAGDWSCLYLWITDCGLTFLVRKAWGDCPSGCIHSHFWYFRESESGIDFVGDWDGTIPVPRWWEEAKVAYYRYRGFDGR